MAVINPPERETGKMHLCAAIWAYVYKNGPTEVRFVSFFSGGFTTMAVMNPPEKKLEKRTSVHWDKFVSEKIFVKKICECFCENTRIMGFLITYLPTLGPALV